VTISRITGEERATRESLVSDPHRPDYHFLPASNWMNDPNGLIQWKGKYHLFYQLNPNGPFHGTIHWGHAVSDDLVRWADLPIALTPTPGGPDEDGCWSGCAVDNSGVPTIVYTGLKGETQVPCLATSENDLVSWSKCPGNPVISGPPESLAVIGFRDHHVWKEGGVWYQVIGSGIEGVGGAILLYESPDLIHWKYLHPLLVGDKDETELVWTGTMWECPQLVPFGEKHVLIISCHDDGNLLYSAYFVGTYSERKFIPETLRVTDLGGYFYAPQTLVDDKGRRLMWGWLQEGRDEEAIQDAGWAGVMSLPRAISLRPGDSLSIEPVPELQTLRSKHYRLEGIDLTPKTSSVLEDIKGDRLEIVAEFAPGSAREVGVKVRCSPAGEEQTIISYDRSSEQLAIDRSRSSLSSNVHRDTQGGMLELADHQTLWLHIFLDRSVVEVFANGRECLSERIYPSLADSVGLDLFARGGTAKLNSVDVWELESIWTAK